MSLTVNGHVVLGLTVLREVLSLVACELQENNFAVAHFEFQYEC